MTTVEITKLKTKADAAAALETAVDLKAEADALMLEHGISELLDKAEVFKKAATDYCEAKGIDRLELSGDRYAKMIQAAHERMIVGTKADMPDDAPQGLVPLKKLIPKELWLKVTRRVPDADKLESAIQDGLLTVEDISPAYYEKLRRPYLRVFGG